MSHEDLVDVTHINKDTVQQCLKKFVESGIIERKWESHKMRIYLCWYHLTEFEVVDSTRTKPIIVFKEIDEKEHPFTKKKIIRKPIQKNKLAGYPDHFIASVFHLFKFNDLNSNRINIISARTVTK